MNNSKKIMMFLFGIVLFVAFVASVDAALCQGFDGYYHDCGYNYGLNSYGSNYGSGHGSSSYGNYQDKRNGNNVVYLNNNNYKKYNPINDYQKNNGPSHLLRCDFSQAIVFRIQRNLPHTSGCGFKDSSDYIYSGPGYDRTRNDNYARYYDDRDHNRYQDNKIRIIKDERTYEYRPQVDPNAKQFKIYIVGEEDHHSHKDKPIRLGSGYEYSIWSDGDPYHKVSGYENPVRGWNVEGENHCPDGFVCLSGSYY